MKIITISPKDFLANCDVESLEMIISYDYMSVHLGAPTCDSPAVNSVYPDLGSQNCLDDPVLLTLDATIEPDMLDDVNKFGIVYIDCTSDELAKLAQTKLDEINSEEE